LKYSLYSFLNEYKPFHQHSKMANKKQKPNKGNPKEKEAAEEPNEDKTQELDFSSKIKDIFIELHNYSFFHSPTASTKVYSRYVGRKQIRNKLEAILSNSETKSGAYLITGFRGMGKTSLVRKVINELKGNQFYATYRHIRIFLITLILCLLGDKVYSSILFYLPVLSVNIAIVWYWIEHDVHRPNRHAYYATFEKKGIKYLFELFRSFFRIFDTEYDYYKRDNFIVFIQDIFLVSVIFMLTIFSILSFDETERVILDNKNFITKSSIVFWISFFYFLLIFLNNTYEVEVRKKRKPKGVITAFKTFYIVATNLIKRFNHGQRVSLEISLSQDDLKEIDILKLLAKNLLASYKSFTRDVFKLNRLGIPIFLFLLLYTLVGSTFYNDNIYKSIIEYRSRIGLNNWLPSQAIFEFTSDTRNVNGENKNKAIKTFISELKENDLSESAYISKINRIISIRDGDDNIRPIKPLSLNEKFRATVVLIDQIILSKYCNAVWPEDIEENNEIPIFYKFNMPSVFLSRNFSISKDFRYIPLLPDYLFTFTLILLLAISISISRNSWRLGIMNHRRILKRLKNLNQNISAHVVMEKGYGAANGGASIPFLSQTLNFFNRRTAQQPIAGIREIESELIDILRDIDRIPAISARPEFTFIFDELDKIEPNYNPSIAEKENQELVGFQDEDQSPFTSESSRKRQQAIFKILGNLKLFFNTANAKFIFIAGREMYDSALADISDRDSFISSIFHEIIYVNSFFKDPESKETYGITGLTEKYVCQLLMPIGTHYDINLKGYQDYLMNEFYTIKSWKYQLDVSYFRFMRFIFQKYRVYLKRFHFEKKIPKPQNKLKYSDNRHPEEIRREIRKIIHTLQHFIVYLAYRSNGAPKKITKLLESYVVLPEKKFLVYNADRYLNDEYSKIVVGKNHNNLYLKFNYNAQYVFGLANYLFRPFIIANSRHMQDYSDKLLIAITFLMDHIYKYHNAAFSMRNLELTPELIAINKTPQLREFINRMLSFLANNHIHRILSGLHEYKFHQKIGSEIAFVSKISDVENAAFNFTLDESLLIKRHYKKKLRQALEHYKPYRESGSYNNHIYSIGYLQMIIGDLHFYDQEYDEAALQYQDSLQFMRDTEYENRDKEESVTQFLAKVRFMLKLALSFERMQAFDTAFHLYGKLNTLVQEFAQVKSYSKFISSHPNRDAWPWHENKSEKNLSIAILGNLRLLYQPLLAQLQLIEKGSLNRITWSNLDRSYNEFKLIIKGIDLDEKFLISAEYFSKVGNILYYKNGYLGLKRDDLGNKCYSIKFYSNQREQTVYLRDCYAGIKTIYDRTAGNFSSDEEKSDFLFTKRYEVPILAYWHYLLSVKYLIDPYIPKSNNRLDISSNNIHVDIINNILNQLYSKDSSLVDSPFKLDSYFFTDTSINMLSDTYYITLGTVLSNLGDSLVCFISSETKIHLKSIFTVLSADIENLKDIKQRASYNNKYFGLVETVISYFLLSGSCFQKANRPYRYAVQIRKILYLLKGILKNNLFNSRLNNPTRSDTHGFEILFKLDIEAASNPSYQTDLNIYILNILIKLKNISTDHVKDSSYSDILKKLTNKESSFIFTKGSSEDIYHENVYNLLSLLKIVLVDRVNKNFDRSSSFTRYQEFAKTEDASFNVFRRFNEVDVSRFGNEYNNISKHIDYEDFWLKVASNNGYPEIKETVILFEEIKLLLGASDKYGIWRLTCPYTVTHNKFVRTMELNLKLNLCLNSLDSVSYFKVSDLCKPSSAVLDPYMFIKTFLLNGFNQYLGKVRNLSEVYIEMTYKEKNNNEPDSLASNYQLFELLKSNPRTLRDLSNVLADAIFCAFEIMRIYRISGINYMHNRTFMGLACYELGQWCVIYRVIRQFLRTQNQDGFDLLHVIESRLYKVIKRQNLHHLGSSYFFELALDNLEAAEQLHNEGDEYYSVIKGMFYLDDDFDDAQFHSCAALERLRINTKFNGKVKRDIERFWLPLAKRL